MSALIAGGSLIQGSVLGVPVEGRSTVGNLEAVVLKERGAQYELVHYWRDQVLPDRPWQYGGLITGSATGPGSICQRRNGNLEMLVPEPIGVAHYTLNYSISGGVRKLARLAASGASGPGMILENRRNQNLEAIVLHGSSLVHHWFDSAWHAGSIITDRASGPPAMIQSDYDEHLEVIVPEGDDLILYWLDGFGSGFRWRSGELVTNAGDGPIGFVQGGYGAAPHSNFELVVPRGDTLCHYWRQNYLPDAPWRPGGLATWGAGSVIAASLISSQLEGHWLQALTQEATSIYHLHRQELGGKFRWMRSFCMRLNDTALADTDSSQARSVKVGQITGDFNTQHQTMTPPPPSLSQSLTRSGIRGTDLGVTVRHRGRAFMLFGDTHWRDPSLNLLDSIAEVIPTSPTSPPQFSFHGAPLEIVGGPVTMCEYDVPLDGFSAAGQLFVFFTSDHFCRHQVMGRSVLTRALDPHMPIREKASHRLQFQLLSTFSSFRFINVSVQVLPATAIPGFGRIGQIAVLWGSGAYRADDLRLAVLPLGDPAVWSYLQGHQQFEIEHLGVRYFAGLCDGLPLWSAHEDEARPVFYPGAFGELSVRWIPEVRRFVLLAASGSDDPIGLAITMRTANAPWGPWSRRRQVFDWQIDGMGLRARSMQFIHNVNAVPPDQVGDNIFAKQANSSGAGYAPYLFDARIFGGLLVLRYTISTWNPYQVMLMSHTITLQELGELEGAGRP